MLSVGDEKILIAVFIMVIICIAVVHVSYAFGYRDAMHKASEMLDSEFEKRFGEAKVVVKKDDRVIECNGMAVPLVCKQCMLGHVHVDDREYRVECFAPDIDGVPVIGLRKPNDK